MNSYKQCPYCKKKGVYLVKYGGKGVLIDGKPVKVMKGGEKVWACKYCKRTAVFNKKLRFGGKYK